MLNWTEIWEIWRQSQHLELVDVFLVPFLNYCSFVAGYIILLKDATAIKEYHFYESVHGLQQCLDRTFPKLYTASAVLSFSIVHPGAMCSPGKRRTFTWPST